MAALPSNTDRSTYTHSGHTLHVCDHLDDDDDEFITLIARVNALRQTRRLLMRQFRILEEECRATGEQRDMVSQRWQDMEGRSAALRADNAYLADTLTSLEQQAAGLEEQHTQTFGIFYNPQHSSSCVCQLANAMAREEPASLARPSTVTDGAAEEPTSAGAACAGHEDIHLHTLDRNMFVAGRQGHQPGWAACAIKAAVAASTGPDGSCISCGYCRCQPDTSSMGPLGAAGRRCCKQARAATGSCSSEHDHHSKDHSSSQSSGAQQPSHETPSGPISQPQQHQEHAQQQQHHHHHHHQQQQQQGPQYAVRCCRCQLACRWDMDKWHRGHGGSPGKQHTRPSVAGYMQLKGTADRHSMQQQLQQPQSQVGVMKRRVVVGPVGPALHCTRPAKRRQVQRADAACHSTPGERGAEKAAATAAGTARTRTKANNPRTSRLTSSSRDGGHTFPTANLRRKQPQPQRQHHQQQQVVPTSVPGEAVPSAWQQHCNVEDEDWDPSILPDGMGSQVQCEPPGITGRQSACLWPSLAPRSSLLRSAPELLPGGPDIMMSESESALVHLQGLEELLPENTAHCWAV